MPVQPSAHGIIPCKAMGVLHVKALDLGPILETADAAFQKGLCQPLFLDPSPVGFG